MVPEDAVELSYLELEIFSSPWSGASFRNCLELATVEGEAAIIDGEIIGYLIVQCVYDEGHILNLAVRPDYRRRGVAKILLKRFLEHVKKRNVSLMYLEVRVGNRAAQGLYFGFSFAPVSVRKKYYPDGEDALILMRKI